MKRNNYSACLCCLLVCVLSLSPGFGGTALAAGPGQDETTQTEPAEYTAVDGYQIPEDERNDSVVEYQELGSLIHFNNDSVNEILADTEETRNDYTEIRDFFQSEKSSARRDRDEAEEDGNPEDYAENAALVEVYQSAIKGYNDSLKRLDKYSYNRDRIVLERQLTSTAQSLMISRQSLVIQKEYLEKAAELYGDLYENQNLQTQAGLSTERSVLDAYNKWQAAENSLSALEENQSDIERNLCLLLGIDENGGMEFQSIPPVELERMTELDLEPDTERSVNNNTEMITLRKTSSDGSSSGVKNKRRQVNELEEEIRIEMQTLYNKALQAKQSYDAAWTGLSGAETNWTNHQARYSMGMLSQAEYTQEEMTYIQKKTNFESAELSLFQALQNYEWAVNGIL